MFISQKISRKIFKERLIINVSPGMVRYYVGTNRPLTIKTEVMIQEYLGDSAPVKAVKMAIAAFHPFILSPSRFPEIVPLDGLEKYMKVDDFVRSRHNYRESQWYKNLISRLHTDGVVFHKQIQMSTETEVDDFFTSYVCNFIDSISVEGYRPDLSPKVPTGMIGADGEIYKSDGGNHRFAAARCLGVERFPLLIRCVHADWLKTNGVSPIFPSLAGLEKILEVIRDSYYAQGA